MIKNENDLVTYEQAKFLAETLDYRGKCKYVYDADSGRLTETNTPLNHNLSKSWTGTKWKFSRYSAPTKDEAFNYLCEIISVLLDKEYDKQNHEN